MDDQTDTVTFFQQIHLKPAIHFYIFSICLIHTTYVQKSNDYKIAAHTHGGVDSVSAILVFWF